MTIKVVGVQVPSWAPRTNGAARAISSAGQSATFTPWKSEVRALYRPPAYGAVDANNAKVAQLVELTTENRAVRGSSPRLGTFESTIQLSRSSTVVSSAALY